MQHSIREELKDHLINTIVENFEEDDTNFEELHHVAFNEGYYVIYHSVALDWLKNHDIDAFEAISEVIEWERDTFGEVQLSADDINPEKVVNLYVYIKGEELVNELGIDDLYDTTYDEVLEAAKSL